MFDENLKKRFANTYKYSNHDINKFILLLQKRVYPYEYIDDWQKLSETSFPKKENFHLKDNTDAHCKHAKRVCKDF